MTKRNKSIIAVVSLVAVVIAAVSVYFIFFNNSNGVMKVRGLGNSDSYHQFQSSSMHLNKNKTFSIEIIQDEEIHVFSAVGTYTKSGGKVYFTFIDAWVQKNNDFVRDDSGQYIGKTIDYSISKKNQVAFIDNQGRTFYFR